MRKTGCASYLTVNKKGAVVAYNDPYVPQLPKMRGHNLNMKSVELSEEKIKSYDCVLIATNHSSYDYKWIVNNSQLIVDTRNATNGINSKKIVKS